MLILSYSEIKMFFSVASLLNLQNDRVYAYTCRVMREA